MGYGKARSKVGFPKSVTINNVAYPRIALKATSYDGDGVPRTLELLRDDEPVNLAEGELVYFVYGPPNMVPERKN